MQGIKNKGFTLVELMISIVLGLLVVAAALQLFFTGQVSLNLQKSMADIQANSNFGINYITSDIRKANYFAEKPVITNQTKFGGIVIGEKNLPLELNSNLSSEYVSKASVGLSPLTDVASDQLTIQYYVSEGSVFDCEGRAVAVGNYVIQRYFVEEGNLKCDAGSYPASAPTTRDENNVILPYVIEGIGENAQTIIKNVEYMRVLLAISTDKLPTDDSSGDDMLANTIVQKNFRYIAIDNYPTTETISPRIRGIQIGLLMRANEAVSATDELKNKNKALFSVLDKEVELNTKDSKFLRQVVIQTIALRNAMGASS